jgi:hypothetical protein
MVMDRMDTDDRLTALDAGFMAELEYEKSAQEIAIEITDQLPTIFSSDLRELIAKYVEVERRQVKEWLDRQS